MHLLHRSIVHRLQTLRFEGWTIPSIAPCQPCFHFSLSWSFSCVTSIDAAPFGKYLSVRQTHRRKKQKQLKNVMKKFNINGLFCQMIVLTLQMLLCSLCYSRQANQWLLTLNSFLSLCSCCFYASFEF